VKNESKSQRKFTRADRRSLLAQLEALVNNANSLVVQERRVSLASAVEVANRDLRKTRRAASDSRIFSALRAVSAHLSLALNNRQTTASLSNADLLPIGHPASTRKHAMTASALRYEKARWLAADTSIGDETRRLVIAAHAAEPFSAERAHAFARLGVTASGVSVALSIDPIVAVGGFGLGGNSKAARSARAQLQRRDRYGRFAFMGGGFSFSLRMLDGLMKSVSGRVVGASGTDDVEVEVKGSPDLKDGIYAFPASKGQSVRAILNRPGVSRNVTDSTYVELNEIKTLDAPSGWKKIDDGVYQSDDGYFAKVDPGTGEYTLHRANLEDNSIGEEVDRGKSWADVQRAARKDSPKYEDVLKQADLEGEGKQVTLNKPGRDYEAEAYDEIRDEGRSSGKKSVPPSSRVVSADDPQAKYARSYSKKFERLGDWLAAGGGGTSSDFVKSLRQQLTAKKKALSLKQWRALEKIAAKDKSFDSYDGMPPDITGDAADELRRIVDTLEYKGFGVDKRLNVAREMYPIQVSGWSPDWRASSFDEAVKLTHTGEYVPSDVWDGVAHELRRVWGTDIRKGDKFEDVDVRTPEIIGDGTRGTYSDTLLENTFGLADDALDTADDFELDSPGHTYFMGKAQYFRDLVESIGDGVGGLTDAEKDRLTALDADIKSVRSGGNVSDAADVDIPEISQVPAGPPPRSMQYRPKSSFDFEYKRPPYVPGPKGPLPNALRPRDIDANPFEKPGFGVPSAESQKWEDATDEQIAAEIERMREAGATNGRSPATPEQQQKLIDRWRRENEPPDWRDMKTPLPRVGRDFLEPLRDGDNERRPLGMDERDNPKPKPVRPRNPNAGKNLSDLTDKELKKLLAEHNKYNWRPWDRDGLRTTPKVGLDSIVAELNRRGYEVTRSDPRKASYYGDYSSGDTTYSATKPGESRFDDPDWLKKLREQEPPTGELPPEPDYKKVTWNPEKGRYEAWNNYPFTDDMGRPLTVDELRERGIKIEGGPGPTADPELEIPFENTADSPEQYVRDVINDTALFEMLATNGAIDENGEINWDVAEDLGVPSGDYPYGPYFDSDGVIRPGTNIQLPDGRSVTVEDVDGETSWVLRDANGNVVNSVSLSEDDAGRYLFPKETSDAVNTIDRPAAGEDRENVFYDQYKDQYVDAEGYDLSDDDVRRMGGFEPYEKPDWVPNYRLPRGEGELPITEDAALTDDDRSRLAEVADKIDALSPAWRELDSSALRDGNLTDRFIGIEEAAKELREFLDQTWENAAPANDAMKKIKDDLDMVAGEPDKNSEGSLLNPIAQAIDDLKASVDSELASLQENYGGNGGGGPGGGGGGPDNGSRKVTITRDEAEANGWFDRNPDDEDFYFGDDDSVTFDIEPTDDGGYSIRPEGAPRGDADEVDEAELIERFGDGWATGTDSPPTAPTPGGSRKQIEMDFVYGEDGKETLEEALEEVKAATGADYEIISRRTEYSWPVVRFTIDGDEALEDFIEYTGYDRSDVLDNLEDAPTAGGDDSFSEFFPRLPEGASKFEIFLPYEPKGRTSAEMSPDYTDDPEQLATKFSGPELVRALNQAVSPDGGGNGFGDLSFEDGDDSVPAQAIYEAIANQGLDAEITLAKIYDMGLPPGSGTPNEDRINQVRDDMGLEVPSGARDDSPDQIPSNFAASTDAVRLSGMVATPAHARRVNALIEAHEETNSKLVEIADYINENIDAELESDSDGNEYAPISKTLKKFLPWATSADPQEREAFRALWGAMMSIDGGSSDPRDLGSNGSIRTLIYGEILDKSGGNYELADIEHDELWAEFGGFDDFTQARARLADGIDDLSANTSAAALYRLAKSASRRNERPLYRAISVDPENEALITELTTVGSRVSIDPRSFTQTRITDGTFASQLFFSERSKRRVVFELPTGAVDSFDLQPLSWFTYERESLGFGDFEVDSVRTQPLVADPTSEEFIVRLRRVDTVDGSGRISPASGVVSETGDDLDSLGADTYNGIEDWVMVDGQRGSNIGGTFEFDGKEYYVKTPKSRAHAEQEVLAGKLYNAVGIPAANTGFGDDGGELRIVSPIVQGDRNGLETAFNEGDQEFLDKVRDGFAVDAWLGNWDALGLGLDNIVADEDGNPVRIDQGATMFHRARGSSKRGAFGDQVWEVDVLTDPDLFEEADGIYSTMTDNDISRSARHLLNITPARIDTIVDSVISNREDAETLKSTLKARREYLLNRYGVTPDAAGGDGPEGPGDEPEGMATSRPPKYNKNSDGSVTVIFDEFELSDLYGPDEARNILAGRQFAEYRVTSNGDGTYDVSVDGESIGDNYTESDIEDEFGAEIFDYLEGPDPMDVVTGRIQSLKSDILGDVGQRLSDAFESGDDLMARARLADLQRRYEAIKAMEPDQSDEQPYKDFQRAVADLEEYIKDWSNHLDTGATATKKIEQLKRDRRELGAGFADVVEDVLADPGESFGRNDGEGLDTDMVVEFEDAEGSLLQGVIFNRVDGERSESDQLDKFEVDELIVLVTHRDGVRLDEPETVGLVSYAGEPGSWKYGNFYVNEDDAWNAYVIDDVLMADTKSKDLINIDAEIKRIDAGEKKRKLYAQQRRNRPKTVAKNTEIFDAAIAEGDEKFRARLRDEMRAHDLSLAMADHLLQEKDTLYGPMAVKVPRSSRPVVESTESAGDAVIHDEYLNDPRVSKWLQRDLWKRIEGLLIPEEGYIVREKYSLTLDHKDERDRSEAEYRREIALAERAAAAAGLELRDMDLDEAGNLLASLDGRERGPRGLRGPDEAAKATPAEALSAVRSFNQKKLDELLAFNATLDTPPAYTPEAIDARERRERDVQITGLNTDFDDAAEKIVASFEKGDDDAARDAFKKLLEKYEVVQRSVAPDPSNADAYREFVAKIKPVTNFVREWERHLDDGIGMQKRLEELDRDRDRLWAEAPVVVDAAMAENPDSISSEDEDFRDIGYSNIGNVIRYQDGDTAVQGVIADVEWVDEDDIDLDNDSFSKIAIVVTHRDGAPLETAELEELHDTDGSGLSMNFGNGGAFDDSAEWQIFSTNVAGAVEGYRTYDKRRAAVDDERRRKRAAEERRTLRTRQAARDRRAAERREQLDGLVQKMMKKRLVRKSEFFGHEDTRGLEHVTHSAKQGTTRIGDVEKWLAVDMVKMIDYGAPDYHVGTFSTIDDKAALRARRKDYSENIEEALNVADIAGVDLIDMDIDEAGKLLGDLDSTPQSPVRILSAIVSLNRGKISQIDSRLGEGSDFTPRPLDETELRTPAADLESGDVLTDDGGFVVESVFRDNLTPNGKISIQGHYPGRASQRREVEENELIEASKNSPMQPAGDLPPLEEPQKPKDPPRREDYYNRDNGDMWYENAMAFYTAENEQYLDDLAKFHTDRVVGQAWKCGGGGIQAAIDGGDDSCPSGDPDDLLNAFNKSFSAPDPSSRADGPDPYAGEPFPPTPQQREVVDAVLTGDDVVVRALAGTGKTSTLQLIARRLKREKPRQRIVYVAFNKSIQLEAQSKMPDNVESRTGDSIAYRAMPKEITAKMRSEGRLTKLKEIATAFGIGPSVNPDRPDNSDEKLSSQKVTSIIRKAVEKYAISADDEIGPQHFQFNNVPDEWVDLAQQMWTDINDPNGRLRVTNSHITKMWALTRPDLSSSGSGLGRPADVIFFDEAQDINPVMGKVIADQKIQKVYVGDENQAIYGFRGSENQLESVEAPHDLPLTKSWRFGPQVAGMGNRFLKLLKARHRVEGGGPAGEILERGEMTDPEAILVRSNAGGIRAIAGQLAAGRTVGVSKAYKDDISSLIESAAWLKEGGDSPDPKTRPMVMHEDIAPYSTWKEVEAAVADGEAPKVAMLTKLFSEYSADDLRDMIDRVKIATPGETETKRSKLPDTFWRTGSSGSLGGGLDFEVKEVDDRRDYRNYVALSGNTFEHKDKIKKAGFKWDSGSKQWYAAGIGIDRRKAIEKLSSLIDGTSGDEKIDVVITTAHKAKGLEWDDVQIYEDFWGPRVDKDTGEMLMPSDEELRLAYVAVTRAKRRLDPGALAWVYEHTSSDDEKPQVGAPDTDDRNAPAAESAPEPAAEPEAAPIVPTDAEIDAELKKYKLVDNGEGEWDAEGEEWSYLREDMNGEWDVTVERENVGKTKTLKDAQELYNEKAREAAIKRLSTPKSEPAPEAEQREELRPGQTGVPAEPDTSTPDMLVDGGGDGDGNDPPSDVDTAEFEPEGGDPNPTVEVSEFKDALPQETGEREGPINESYAEDLREQQGQLDEMLEEGFEVEGARWKPFQKSKLQEIVDKAHELHKKYEAGTISREQYMEELDALREDVPNYSISTPQGMTSAIIGDQIEFIRKMVDQSAYDRPIGPGLPPPDPDRPNLGYSKNGVFLVPGMRVRDKWGYAGTVVEYDKNGKGEYVYIRLDVDHRDPEEIARKKGAWGPRIARVTRSNKTLMALGADDDNSPWLDVGKVPEGKKPKSLELQVERLKEAGEDELATSTKKTKAWEKGNLLAKFKAQIDKDDTGPSVQDEVRENMIERRGDTSKPDGPNDLDDIQDVVRENMEARRAKKLSKAEQTRAARTIGPREVGGRYRSGYWRSEYEVLEINIDDEGHVELVVRGEDGEVRRHSTPWDPKRDSEVSPPNNGSES
jgi:hypothetical protein